MHSLNGIRLLAKPVGWMVAACGALFFVGSQGGHPAAAVRSVSGVEPALVATAPVLGDAPATAAQRTIEPGHGLIEPAHRQPRPIIDRVVQRVRSDVTIRVDGARRVAHVEVEEVFRNLSGRMVEGDYLYPIPPGAVFTDFSLYMGEQELRGEVLPADRARAIYEDIVRRKKDPALIELFDHGLLRARVFPIDPGDSRRVVLRYSQILGRDGELVRLGYRQVVGMLEPEPRPEPGPIRPMTEAAQAWPRPTEQYPFTLTIRVDGAGGFATPYSPTHTIEVRSVADDRLEISHESTVAAPRDFELLLPLRDELVGANVLTHAPYGEDGYYMLLLSPPAQADEQRIPRDVTLVLDVSGSMAGDKIVQARAALDQVLGSLRPADRFRLITYSSVVRAFRQEFSSAAAETLRQAREYLAGVRAEGSTNLEAALTEALRPTADSGRLAQILFLTDGQPTVGETAPERIVELARSLLDRERVFAFGVGHDVNTYLIDALTAGARGTVNYVRPGEDVEVAVASLSRKIGYPALSDLRIVSTPVVLEDSYPAQLPDLFYGEDLVLFGRYRGHGSGELVVEGQRAGATQRFRFSVEFADQETGNTFIPRLWASRKAGALAAQIRLNGADPELIEEIRQLGLRYGVLTEYTSYLVDEPNLPVSAVTAGELFDRARRMDAPAEAQVGAIAFERAERSAKLRQARTVQEAEAAPAALPIEGDEAGVAGRRSYRQVVDRLFVLADGIWTDRRAEPDAPVVAVAPYSEAYFELVQRVPGIRPFLALGDRVIIAGEGLTLELRPKGLTAWAPGQLAEVVAAFEPLH